MEKPECTFVSIRRLHEEFGFSCEHFRRMARAGQFPEGTVIATPGGHRRFHLERVRKFFVQMDRKLTKTRRMEGVG